LGLVEAGGNYSTIKRKIAELKLDVSHFLGRGWKKGDATPVVPARPLEAVLVKGSFYQSYKLKRRLVREGIKEERCENCGLSVWQNQQIPLELHHINGDSTDNRLENLVILCPNCHALTENYRAKNTRKV
ncbi:MAG: HNH endonuclease, partial [Candidatus Electryoneaceae bacterium]|nr:HNH endonuclease [Candidatus Electryoneaceae bacterium]